MNETPHMDDIVPQGWNNECDKSDMNKNFYIFSLKCNKYELTKYFYPKGNVEC